MSIWSTPTLHKHGDQECSGSRKTTGAGGAATTVLPGPHTTQIERYKCAQVIDTGEAGRNLETDRRYRF